MKYLPKSITGKVLLSIVVATVAVGIFLVTGSNAGADESGVMVKLFLLFLGVIIAIQVVPGMLLFGAMIKGIGSLTRKESIHKADK